MERNGIKRRLAELGAGLKQRRETLGWTREDLEKAAKVPLNWIALIERGEMDAPHAYDKLSETILRELERRRIVMEVKRRANRATARG